MRMGKLVAAVALCALAAACEGSGNEQTPSPTPSEAKPTPELAAASPVSPTPTATPRPVEPETYALPGSSELFVYTVEVGSDSFEDRRVPRRVAVVQDLATGRVLTWLNYGGIRGMEGHYPVDVQLAGRRLIVATESAVTRYELDGSGETRLLTEPNAGAGGYFGIQDIAVSGDGQHVAVSHGCGFPCESGTAVSIVEIATGRLVVEAGYASLRAAGFAGYVWQLVWRDDVPGVLLVGATGSEAPGGRAIVGLDTEVVGLERPSVYGSVSPDGRFSFQNPLQLTCEYIGGTRLS